MVHTKNINNIPEKTNADQSGYRYTFPEKALDSQIQQLFDKVTLDYKDQNRNSNSAAAA